MKKKLFTLLLCAFSAIGVNASAVFSDGGKTLTLTDFTDNDYQGITTTQLNAVETLIIVGTISGNEWNNNMKGQFTGVKTLNCSGMDATDFTNKANDWKDKFKTVENISFPAGLTTIPADCFNGNTSLKSVTIPNTVTVIGARAFYKCSSLTSVTYEETPHVETFSQYCFYQTGLTSVTIPGSAKEIQLDAFGECASLKTVTFAENVTADLIVRSQAFDNSSAIEDIYILGTAHFKAENMAFEDDITYAHGQTHTKLAVLHFPESESEYFSNLNDYLDIETAQDEGLLQHWLVNHYGKAQGATEGNGGFWEFVTTGASDPDNPDPEIPEGKFLKTYSHPTLAHIVPDGVKAYIVNDIKKDSSQPNVLAVQLKSVGFIPANTGVILYGETNATTPGDEPKPALALSVVRLAKSFKVGNETRVVPEGQEGPDGKIVDLSMRRSNWAEYEDDKEFINYLEPTAGTTDLRLNPFETDATTGKVTFRSFGFSHFAKTKLTKPSGFDKTTGDYAGFFRSSKNSKIGADKAYLRLKVGDEITESLTGDELELYIIPDANYTMRAEAKSSAGAVTQWVNEYDESYGGYWHNAVWTKPEDFGVRPANQAAAKFMDEPIFEEDEATGIAKLLIPIYSEEDCYYNLQGQKVVNPSQGVYLKNGKKVIIK